MPASMISAPTGGRPKVIGSSIATVAMVPMPGSTPTSVPTSAPIRQKHEVHRRERDAEAGDSRLVMISGEVMSSAYPHCNMKRG